MSIKPIFNSDKYDDGRAKQAFKDSCDINKIIKKAQKVGSLAFAQKYDKQVFGEFSGVDLLGAYQQVERAREIFAELPSEVRKEFGNDALKFAGFASDPENIDRLGQLIPAIAEPGRYFPNPVQRGGSGAGAATAPKSETPPAGTQIGEKGAQAASEAGSATPPPVQTT